MKSQGFINPSSFDARTLAAESNWPAPENQSVGSLHHWPCKKHTQNHRLLQEAIRQKLTACLWATIVVFVAGWHPISFARHPESISSRFRFRSSKPVNPRAVKATIPAHKDWSGLRVTPDSLLELKTPPQKIVVANDNPEPGVPAWLSGYPIGVVDYAGNLDPAKAAQLGQRRAK
jgi:hypothetical protein